MTYFLDTNICIYGLAGRYPSIQQRLVLFSPAEIKIAMIVQAELLLAAEKSNRRERTLRTIVELLAPYEVVPFDGAAAAHYARIRADLERRGKPVGPNDLVLASTVLARGGTLVTHDTKELRRVTGLRLEDWTRPAA